MQAAAVPNPYVEYHLHRDTLAVRHCVVEGRCLVFHECLTRADSEAGWEQVSAHPARGLTAPDIAAAEQAHVRSRRDYWLELLERHTERRVVSNGYHRVWHDLGTSHGYDGQVFRVRWLDTNRAPVLCNMSGQGPVPAWIRDRLPDNAVVEVCR